MLLPICLIFALLAIAMPAKAGVVRHAAKDTKGIVVHAAKDTGRAIKGLVKLVI